MSQFRFKKGATATSSGKVLKVVDLGGQEVTILRDSFKGCNGEEMFTIEVNGAGKPKKMGPQAALSIIAAAEEIESYFREVGVIE